MSAPEIEPTPSPAGQPPATEKPVTEQPAVDTPGGERPLGDKTAAQKSPAEKPSGIRSLRELIDQVSGRNLEGLPQEDSGLAEALPFPFLALVGQSEMKLALCLNLINPFIGGVLLVGPRGTGKTTAVRSLLDLLPQIDRSACFYGCLPEDIETGGMDAVCPECAKKYAEGRPLTIKDRVKLVELPLNATLDDVVGGIDERASATSRLRIKRGVLAMADQNVLYVDEVNLLADEIVDAILDAAAFGSYTVRRGIMTGTYRSRFTLIGSMNPEEGFLRPQIMDRFGLRVVTRGLEQPEERLEAYRRVRAYRSSPRAAIAAYYDETAQAIDEITRARQLLHQVDLTDEVAKVGIRLIQKLEIDSLRAEITLFEAARAYAAADNRLDVITEDLRIVAPMALRMRGSEFMRKYFQDQRKEDQGILEILDEVIPPGKK
jgi:magnesium chelatase subunit I